MLLGGAAIAWPLSAGAQQPSQMKRVGVLMGLPKDDLGGQSEFEAFVQALDELGWREGHNVSMEVRWSTVSADQIAMYAKELVRLRCDVVIGRGTPAVKALLRESPGLPIVFLMVADPIGPGFVQSLARPGGNVTGFTNFEASLGGKWLGLLKEIAPARRSGRGPVQFGYCSVCRRVCPVRRTSFSCNGGEIDHRGRSRHWPDRKCYCCSRRTYRRRHRSDSRHLHACASRIDHRDGGSAPRARDLLEPFLHCE